MSGCFCGCSLWRLNLKSWWSHPFMFPAKQNHILKRTLNSQILRNQCISCLFLVPELLREGFVSSDRQTDRQSDLIKQARDVKKSTTVLDFMDYWRLLRPAGRGIILVSLLNWMRVSGTGVSRVKVIGLTSEYHVCNPLVWYLCALLRLRGALYLSCLYLFSRDDKLPGFHWS